MTSKGDPKKEFFPDIETTVITIGGGISGIWLAVKLARWNIPSVLVTYKGTDRGGLQGASIRSAGAINTTIPQRPDFQNFLNKLGTGVCTWPNQYICKFL